MLSTGTLWFPKAATLLDDPWEGFGIADWFEAPPEDVAPKIVAYRVGGKETNISLPQMAAVVAKASARFYERPGEHVYVNSWCSGATESMAMWQIYGSLGCGLAIKSSVGQYKGAVRIAPGSCHEFGCVTYHDDLESAPEIHRDFRQKIPAPGQGLGHEILKLAFHKRSCYAYEQEWRAALFLGPRPEIAGIPAEFDLEELISEVYVGPRAQGFLFDTVTAVMDKFLLQKPLKRSELLSPPKLSPPRKDAELSHD